MVNVRSLARLVGAGAWFGAAVLNAQAAPQRASEDSLAPLKPLRRLVAVERPPMPFGNFFRGAPGTNSGTPMAFGASWGDVFVGAGYQNATRAVKLANGSWSSSGGGNNDDGSVSVGFGLGDPKDYLGLEVVATSLSTFRSGFGNRTAFSFQAHRLLDASTAIAVGVENAFIAGGGQTDGMPSTFVVATRQFNLSGSDFNLFQSVTVNGGVGNGRFRTLNDVNADNKTWNVFGSVGVTVTDWFAMSTDWTGQDLNVGVSFVPFKQFPVSISPTLADVTQTANKSARFVLGVGLGMHF
ncbi:MAG: hypothetical protein HY084_10610 [Gemmatimonadetes bacterium]|nr:hypothetical protein [Gemmatimonadota bacterium]